MAFSQDFDPASGFVALPCAIMEIDMTPGAFRLLVELCRMANRSGECWPSLAQLSARIGRSKSAISGYIAELRALELVETLNQRMANGYNYRLKYQVTFWQSWRSALSASKPERRVQPAERRVNSKNHIQENQTSRGAPDSDTHHPRLVSVFSRWSDLSRNAPFPGFNDTVPESLITATREILRDPMPEPISSERVSQHLSKLWKARNITINPAEIATQTASLTAHGITQAGIDAFESEVSEIWEPHWKKPPNAHQMQVLLAAAHKRNRREGMLRVLTQYLRRWEISQNKLQAGVASPSLSEKQAA